MTVAAQNKITRSRAVRPSAMLSGVGDCGLAVELSDRFDSLGSGRRSMQPGADPRHHEQRNPNTRPPTDASGWRTKPRPVPQEVRLLGHSGPRAARVDEPSARPPMTPSGHCPGIEEQRPENCNLMAFAGVARCLK